MPAKKRPRAKKAAAQPPAQRGSGRAYSVKLPPDVAERAQAIAKEEGRPMSELLAEALRAYEAVRSNLWLEKARAYAKTRNPHGYTEEDIPRLIQEVRAEIRAEREAGIRKAG